MSNLADRYEKYNEIQNIVINEEVVHLWLAHTQQLYGHNNRVLNYQPHALGYYLLTADLDIE